MDKRKVFQWFRKLLTTTATLIVLAILALATFIIGLVFHIAILQGIGGVVGGAVLSLFITIVTSRETVQQQYAKEANIERKNIYYIPMFNELKQLQDRFEDSQQKTLPYPQWIKVSDNANASVHSVVFGKYPMAAFFNWKLFKEQPYRSNFSQKACDLFDNTQKACANYNDSISAVKDDVIKIIAPHIDKAYQEWAGTDDFKHWQDETQNGIKWSSNQYHQWNAHIHQYLQIPDSSVFDEVRGVIWMYNLLGWILSNDLNKTSEAMYEIYKNDYHITTIPSSNWFKSILAPIWTELQNLSSVKEVSVYVEELLTKTKQAKGYMQERLDYIQDIYEGGKPPL